MDKNHELPFTKTANSPDLPRCSEFSFLPSVHLLLNDVDTTPRTLPPLHKVAMAQPKLSPLLVEQHPPNMTPTSLPNSGHVMIIQPHDLPKMAPLPEPATALTANTRLSKPRAASDTSADLDLKQIQERLLRANQQPEYVHEWNKKQGRGARYKKKIHVTKCPICGKEFTRPSTLKTHMVVHSQAKPFKCSFPGCNKSYNVKSNLRRHEKTHHACRNGHNGNIGQNRMLP